MPSAAPLYFPESLQHSEVPSLSKVILVLGKARGCRVPNLGYREAKSSGWFVVLPKHSAWDVMHEWMHKSANHRLSIAVAFCIIQVVSAVKFSSLMHNLMQIHCSTHSVLLNVRATQYTCSLSGVYSPQWPVQWSHHCSCMCVPVHSPWLPGNINALQTILILVTVAAFSSEQSTKFWVLKYLWVWSPVQWICSLINNSHTIFT